jgi:DNA-directed RNA polymerase subunit RPC12/RpoP
MADSNPVRTDISCTNCSKPFIAQIDFAVDGNHVINCPHCNHEHFREIKVGTVTDVRWNSSSKQIKVSPKCVWKSEKEPIVTSTAAYFIREAWLSKLDSGLA